MAQVTWSWRKAIPQVVKNIRDSIIYSVGALLPFTTYMTQWLHVTAEEYAAASGIVIVGAKFLANLFGVKDELVMKQAAPNDVELTNS